MHPIRSQARPSGHFDSLAAQKYPKILVTIRCKVCYTIPSKGEHRATPERREHKMETEYTYNELTGQWERVERTDTVEDTYTEGRDFETFEI